MLTGKDPIVLEVVNSARIVAATDVTALLVGEAGTGKSTLARAMHAASARQAAPFVHVACSALPTDRAEAILFGVDGGEPGELQRAQSGTLFLDGLAHLPRAAQGRLLGLLETGVYYGCGATRPARADVRVVAASSDELGPLVQAGRFDRDLALRLDIVPLRLPPLRERTGDLPLLARSFLDAAAQAHGLAAPRLRPAALAVLKRYRWPGNLRELRNLMERLALLMPGRELGPENLPVEICTAAAPAEHLVELPEQGLALVDVEESLIRQALERTRGNRSRAARLLGITRDTLLYRLKKFAMR